MTRYTIPLALAILLFVPLAAHALEMPDSAATSAENNSTAPLTVKPLGLDLYLGEEKIAVPQDTINSWRGFSQVPPSNIYRKPSASAGILIAGQYGIRRAEYTESQSYSYKTDAIYAYVRQLAGQFDKPVVEPKLTIENGRAAEFVPPQDGKYVDAYATTFGILHALSTNQASTTIVSVSSKPKTPLASTNNLGINELIAHGESGFAGSSSNRRTNVRIGAEKVRGTLVAPGEEFSFNTSLGPIEASEGFKPEIVIKRTGLVPEIGGGICQVSSTTFRAIMNGGFKVTQRKNHSFAVSHYAPQGTDATIYPGVIDLKFVNDTPNYILIWAYFPTKDTLVFDFYGTNDGRTVAVDKPVQYDRKSDGSLKATWTRTVTKNGESRKDEFKSVYLPPSLFKKEEQQSVPAMNVGTTPTAINQQQN